MDRQTSKKILSSGLLFGSGAAAIFALLGVATGGKAGTGAVVGGALGAVAGNLWSKRQEDRRLALEQSTRGTGVEVSRTADNQLKLNIPADVSFDVHSAAIRPGMPVCPPMPSSSCPRRTVPLSARCWQRRA